VAGTAKDIQVTEVHQGPGDLWVIGTPPVDATPRLVLAGDGTPDSVTHGTCIHLGALTEATTRVKPAVHMLELDQLDAPFDIYLGEVNAELEASFAQVEMSKLARALGVGNYGSGSGYKQVTFGGTLVVPTFCLAAVSALKDAALKHIVSVLFKAAAAGGFQVVFGRGQASLYKCNFVGLSDLTRTAGKQLGNVYRTYADCAGGTPTAKDFVLTEVQQGPGDLWYLPDPPTNSEERVTLDATTLTPDAAVHVGSVHLGGTLGPITLTVKPTIGLGRVDQIDGPLYLFVEKIEASLEAEMTQIGVKKLAQCLGVGSYSENASPPTSWTQMTFGGVANPTSFCVAGVAPKRSDATKAFVGCLYRVMPTEGVEFQMSRRKAGTYKVKFTAISDTARTAGKQMGIVHEMV